MPRMPLSVSLVVDAHAGHPPQRLVRGDPAGHARQIPSANHGGRGRIVLERDALARGLHEHGERVENDRRIRRRRGQQAAGRGRVGAGDERVGRSARRRRSVRNLRRKRRGEHDERRGQPQALGKSARHESTLRSLRHFVYSVIGCA